MERKCSLVEWFSVDSVDGQPGVERELLEATVTFLCCGIVVTVFEKRSHYRALAGLELNMGTLGSLGFTCVLLYLDVEFLN